MLQLDVHRRSLGDGLRLRFDVDTDAPQDKLDQLLKLTERYCVVYQDPLAPARR